MPDLRGFAAGIADHLGETTTDKVVVTLQQGRSPLLGNIEDEAKRLGKEWDAARAASQRARAWRVRCEDGGTLWVTPSPEQEVEESPLIYEWTAEGLVISNKNVLAHRREAIERLSNPEFPSWMKMVTGVSHGLMSAMGVYMGAIGAPKK